MTLDATLTLASEVLGSPLSPRETITDDAWARSRIVRCTAGSQSVVVKHGIGDNGNIQNEIATLRFMATTEAVVVAPRIVADAPEREILILEDLGPDDALLGRILENGERSVAVAALEAMQRTLALLHDATIGREEAFEAARVACKARGESSHRVHSLCDALRELPGVFEYVGLSASEAYADMEQAATSLEGAPRCLAHGDGTPANVIVTGAGERLIDFESAAYRSAMVDASFGPLRYLHSLWAMELPTDLRWQLFDVYARSRESVGTDELTTGLVAACAGWMAGLCAFTQSVLEKDRPWGTSSVRQRVLAGCLHFSAVSERVQCLQALGTACVRLHERLHSRWGTEPMSVYPSLSR